VADPGGHSVHLGVSSPGRFVPIRHSLSAIDVREEDGPTIVQEGMGRNVNLGRELRAKLNNFCILNT
jgi:hypothetical protein